MLALGTGGGEEKQPKQIMDIQQNIVYILIARNIHNITTTPSLYCNLTFDFIDILLILHL